MSKWFNEKDFAKFIKSQEKDEDQNQHRNFVIEFPRYGREYNITYSLRFLPAIKDPNPAEFSRKMYFHALKDKDTGKWNYITCPWTYGEKKCPICRIGSKLYASSEKEDLALAYNLRRQQKWLANVYVIEDPRDSKREEKVTGSVRILQFGKQVNTRIKSASDPESKTGVGSAIIDPENGFDFFLKVVENRTKNEVYPDYTQSDFARLPSKLGTPEQIDKIMESVHSIDTYLESVRTSINQIMSFLEEQMLIDHLEDYEKEKILSDSDKNTSDSIEEEDVPMDLETEPEKEVEKTKTKPEPESETIENPEEDEDFLRKLNSLNFDE